VLPRQLRRCKYLIILPWNTEAYVIARPAGYGTGDDGSTTADNLGAALGVTKRQEAPVVLTTASILTDSPAPTIDAGALAWAIVNAINGHKKQKRQDLAPVVYTTASVLTGAPAPTLSP
jgi:hypothetical protein